MEIARPARSWRVGDSVSSLNLSLIKLNKGDTLEQGANKSF